MTLMHYVYLLSVRNTLGRLRWLLDEVGEHPDLVTLDCSLLIQRHLRLILMGERYVDTHIRTTLSNYLSEDALNLVEETIHDCLLFDVNRFLSMDEDNAVVDVTCKWDGDLYIVVEEREIVRRMIDDFDSTEYGRYQIEDESIAKMYCD
jgi:hypothetical protein